MDDFRNTNPQNAGGEKPIPFDDAGGMNVSHSPLNLGGGSQGESTPDHVSASAGKAGESVSWPDRITGVKTFFTKLHAGAIEFLDEQIATWLRDNPGVQIKRTNTIAGDVVGKKIEPNIIITIWY